MGFFLKFANFIKNIAPKDFEIPTYNYYNTSNSSDIQVDFLLCIGGDGTILDTVTSMAGSSIPIVGINTGRLGFLANNSRDDIKLVLDNLIAKNFSLRNYLICSCSLRRSANVLPSAPLKGHALSDETLCVLPIGASCAGLIMTIRAFL